MKNGEKDAAFAFASHMVKTKYEDIPHEAIEVTKTDILDGLGVTLAGSSTSPVCRQVAAVAKEIGGKEESTILVYGGKVPCHMAALVNASLVWALNFHDLYDEYCCHPGCVVFPTALAVAERVGEVSGKEFITAYTLGMDVMGRLGRAAYPPVLFRDWAFCGLFTPQVFGYFGAVAVAGRLLGLSEDDMVSAFGLAYCQTAGNWELLYGVGADKGIWPAFPTSAGVLGALLAQKGIAGPRNSFEGIAGLFKVYFHGEYDAAALTADLGQYFKGVEVSFYAFPCCAMTHAYVVAALRLVNEYRIHSEEVEDITVFVGGKVERLCQPLKDRANPQSMYAAQMSLPFSVAVAVAKGKPRISHFTDEGIKDPDTLRLSSRVSVQSDPGFDRQYGTGISPAKVKITLQDGRVLSSEEKGNRYGHPTNPISKSELIEKFRECASYSAKPLFRSTVDELITLIENPEELDDIREIVRLVS